MTYRMMHKMLCNWPATSPYPPKFECTCGETFGPDDNWPRLFYTVRLHIRANWEDYQASRLIYERMERSSNF